MGLNPLQPIALAAPALSEAATPTLDGKLGWINALSSCEDPTGSTTIKILDVNNKYSYGVLMFQMGTWLWAGRTYGFPTRPENITDADLQKSVARAILDDGGWRNWLICGERTRSKLGEYPA